MDSIGRFVSTVSVARDMLHIIEKLGEEKLKCWGFSYGTFLGVTFASLWPEKLGQIVLDGVFPLHLLTTVLFTNGNSGNVDPEQYSSGEGTHFLADTDAVMNSFHISCHIAGPHLCAFYSLSPSAIETRLTTLLSILKIAPVISSSSPQDKTISSRSVTPQPCLLIPHQIFLK